MNFNKGKGDNDRAQNYGLGEIDTGRQIPSGDARDQSVPEGNLVRRRDGATADQAEQRECSSTSLRTPMTPSTLVGERSRYTRCWNAPSTCVRAERSICGVTPRYGHSYIYG